MSRRKVKQKIPNIHYMPGAGMTLRQRAEQAAREFGEECMSASYAKPEPVCPSSDSPWCNGCKERKRIADAIEREAKAFAEKALRLVRYATSKEIELYESEITVAIEAAEKE